MNGICARNLERVKGSDSDRPWSSPSLRSGRFAVQIRSRRICEPSLTASEYGRWFDTLERVKGIEPSFSAWEADVLPLNYTRKSLDSRQILPFPIVRRLNGFLRFILRVAVGRMTVSVVHLVFSLLWPWHSCRDVRHRDRRVVASLLS